MLTGIVPTGRTKEDWRPYIKTERDFKLAVDSGLAWVVFKDFPYSWADCKKIIEEEKEKVSKELKVISAVWCGNEQ